MKPKSLPHDPLDDLLAAAVHDELTTAQRAELDSLLQNDPAARAAHQEIQTMHDLLERNHRDVRPDESFEERMISAVRRKARAEKAHRETMWESAVVLWHAVKWPLTTTRPRRALVYGLAIVAMIAVVAGVALGPITNGIRKSRGVFAEIAPPRYISGGSDSDSVLGNPAGPAAFAEKTKDIQNSLATAEQFRRTGQYDAATTQLKHVLVEDPYNLAAAKLLEKTISGKNEDGEPSRLEGRQDHLRQVEETWYEPNTAPTVATQNGLKQQTEVVREYPIPKSFEKPRLGNTDVAYSGGEFTPSTGPTPSPVMSGNLPAGVRQTPPKPWQTLLFQSQAKSGETDVTSPVVATTDANGRVADLEAYVPTTPASTTPSPAMFGSLPTNDVAQNKDLRDAIKKQGINYTETAQKGVTLSGYVDPSYTYQFAGASEYGKSDSGKPAAMAPTAGQTKASTPPALVATQAPIDFKRRDVGVRVTGGLLPDSMDSLTSGGNAPPAPAQPASKPGAQTTTSTDAVRKLVRDATLDLEVKSFQKTVDAITDFAKAGGGYLDNSSSQRGGNGKLQGAVVVKVLPENLDTFLLKLRDLGEIKNQSVSTEDVTKDYYDMQARLVNSQHMEAQLTLLLQHTNGKVSDLLQVEREVERVRGEIEQMQGQLKLYDFQVQYATVTINVAEKDLNKAAAYLLQEHDQFALFVHDVEDAFAQSKAAADTFKAEILSANLAHDGNNTMSATLAFSVPPDQIDGFLARVRSLGRVDNFTRTTQRVANDGGDPDQPADDTRTEKDHVQVQLTIRADDESPRQQTQLAIASTGNIDTQAQALKDDAAKAGANVIASNFQRAPDGTETATMSVRLALSKVGDFMPVIEKLGRVESLTVQRNDRPDQAAADPNAPAEIDLTLHNVAAVSFENEPPRQATQLWVSSHDDVDAQSQQVKSDALKAGVAVTGSTFERQPDGTEVAALTFRLPLAQAGAFTAKLEELGKVESLAVQRNDVAGPNSTDPNAPAEISLTLHSEPAVVAENRGVWPTLVHVFGGGIEAFLGSVGTIGVLVAFVLPWVVALFVAAWIGRRVYVSYRARKAA